MALKRLNPYDEVMDSLVERYSSDYRKVKKQDNIELGTEKISKSQYKSRWTKMNQAQRMAEIRKHGIEKIMQIAAPSREAQNGKRR